MAQQLIGLLNIADLCAETRHNVPKWWEEEVHVLRCCHSRLVSKTCVASSARRKAYHRQQDYCILSIHSMFCSAHLLQSSLGLTKQMYAADLVA